MNYYYSKSVPLSNDKKALQKFKTEEAQEQLPAINESVFDCFESVGGLLKKNVGMVDSDVKGGFPYLKRIIEAEGIKGRLSESKGTHGSEWECGHLTGFIDDSWNNIGQFTGKVCKYGFPIDFKSGMKSAYEVLQLKSVKYPVVMDESGYLPKGFQPCEGGVNFLAVTEGTRTDSYNKHLFALRRSGESTDECFRFIELINQVIDDPMDVDELHATVLNSSTYEKLESMTPEGKKDVSLESFEEYLNHNGITIRYNILLKETEYYNLPKCYETSSDRANSVPIKMVDEYKLFTKNKTVSKQTIMDYIFYEADVNAYNPIHEYFEDGSWDGIDRFPIIFSVLGVTDELHRMFIKKWFYQCVAMSYNTIDAPIQSEGVLILSGKEGLGKSRFFSMICPNPRWFRCKANAMRLDNKDNLLSVISGFIVELGEIDATLSSKRADIKSFITASTDNIRKPYAREESTTPRTTSFAGTTNKSEFLNDESGFRRWWNIPIKSIDLKQLEAFVSDTDELHQLWLQCYETVAKDDKCFRLTSDELEQLEERNKEVMEMLPSEDELRLRFDMDAPDSEWIWMQVSALKYLPEYNVPNYSASQIGKALVNISKDYPKVQKKRMKSGMMWLIPPCKKNTDRYRN